MIYTEIQESRLFEGYGLYIFFKSRRLDQFCSGGFQPTDEKLAIFRSSVGTKHLKHAVPTELEWYIMSFSNGLKPVATKWVEPTALKTTCA